MRNTFTKGLIVLGIIFAGISMLLWQRNSYSKEAMRVEVLAPKEAKAGDEIEYSVTYKNNGSILLEQVRLIFEFPSGSMPSEGNSTRVIRRVEDLYPGQEQTSVFKGRLFGKEGDLKEARALIAYRPKNLSATYQSETTSSTLIAEVPLSLDLNLPSQAGNLEPFDFSLTYSSKSSYPLSDLRIKMEYPSGFELIKSSPASLGEGEWSIGSLNERQGGEIALQGLLEGSLGSSSVFKVSIGSWKNGNFILLKEVTKAVDIQNSHLLITQTVNGSSSYVASPGDVLHYEISFRNIGEDNLEDLFLVERLEGKPYDLSSVKANQGRFVPGDNSIVWDGRDMPVLKFLSSGEEGRVDFWVDVKDSWLALREKNFVLRSTVLLGNVKNRLDTKVNSKLSVDQKGFYKEDTFENSGPIPPVAGGLTTYTVVWELQNTSNDLENVKVRALLPEGVQMTGQIAPASAKLSLSENRELEWDAGSLPASSQALSVVFQVQFVPAVEQKGSLAQIMGQVKATGEDTFTTSILEASDNSLDTSLPDDPTVSHSGGIVQ